MSVFFFLRNSEDAGAWVEALDQQLVLQSKRNLARVGTGKVLSGSIDFKSSVLLTLLSSSSISILSACSQSAGTPSYGFQASWWWPASKPHWYSPARPAAWERSNISSSSFERHSHSISTSCHNNVTSPFTCISHAISNSSQWLSLVISIFRGGFSTSWNPIKSVNVCARGRRPSHVFRSFLSIAMCVSNQFAMRARSVTDRLPVHGISVRKGSRFPNHPTAGTERTSANLGLRRRSRRLSIYGWSALLTSSVYAILDGFERMSSRLGISCACTHLPNCAIQLAVFC